MLRQTISLLGVAPRIGYVLPLSSSVWFWPRAGLTYDVLTFSPPTGNSNSVTAGLDVWF